MPQDQYKALNPRDKKQVRNRIGARRFRAKRKGEFKRLRVVVVVLPKLTSSDYVSQLESGKKDGESRIAALEAQVETWWREINELRSRLNMPPLPLPEVMKKGSLGLVVNNGGE
jgi:hypothetical protein